MTDLQEADFLFCGIFQSLRENCHFVITASSFRPGKTAIPRLTTTPFLSRPESSPFIPSLFKLCFSADNLFVTFLDMQLFDCASSMHVQFHLTCANIFCFILETSSHRLGHQDQFCLGFTWEISARFSRWEKAASPENVL